MPALLHPGPFLSGGTNLCHLLLLQLFSAAGSSSTVHEHLWCHVTAGAAVQPTQKLPASETVPFHAHPLLPHLRKICMGSLTFHQNSFLSS